MQVSFDLQIFTQKLAIPAEAPIFLHLPFSLKAPKGE